MRHRRRVANRIGEERGVAALEFALVSFFVLIPILVGVIQFGISYSQYQVLQGAAREGARCAAVQATEFNDCGDPTARVLEAASNYADIIPAGSITFSNVCTDDTIGEDVTVSWPQTFDLDLIGFIPVVPDSVSTTISGTFRCE